jgi:hypothetical protein
MRRLFLFLFVAHGNILSCYQMRRYKTINTVPRNQSSNYGDRVPDEEQSMIENALLSCDVAKPMAHDSTRLTYTYVHRDSCTEVAWPSSLSASYPNPATRENPCRVGPRSSVSAQVQRSDHVYLCVCISGCGPAMKAVQSDNQESLVWLVELRILLLGPTLIGQRRPNSASNLLGDLGYQPLRAPHTTPLPKRRRKSPHRHDGRPHVFSHCHPVPTRNLLSSPSSI